MIPLLPTLILLLPAPAAVAEEVTVQYRLTGLFQPDRVDDLRRQAGTLLLNEQDPSSAVRLVAVDYETAVVTFAYDGAAKHFKNLKPERILEGINGRLSHVSRGTFKAFPPTHLKPDQLKEERIAVAGHDCKGCAYAAYRAIAGIDGVERGVVSFKDGRVTAWIDPARTDRAAQVAVTEAAKPSNQP
jgi:copper chaperone CopZ